jgi:cytochrome c oxidase assembly protein subunit 11
LKKLDKNTRLALYLVIFFVSMIALSFAAVPLYKKFCQKTGFGGTTQRAFEAPKQLAKQVYYPSGQLPKRPREFRVSFDGNVDPALPWVFKPEMKNVSARVGVPVTVQYWAQNLSTKTIVGTATYNVQPDKAGSYFNKIQCFCFTEQVLKPGERVQLPVQFFIDPSISDNREADDVKTITLSYTFYLAKDQGKAAVAGDVNETKTNSVTNTPTNSVKKSSKH